MPYIEKKQRDIKIIFPNDFSFDHPGKLNFSIHKLLEKYLDKNGLNYRSINDIEGALSAVSKEFYRRIAKPYEKQKMSKNGDITFYEKFSNIKNEK